MAPTRLLHRLERLRDRDALHTLAVAAAACVLSFGLVYVGYLVHVLRVARSAPCVPVSGECVLVFGKHSPQGRVDADFQARLSRAATLWTSHAPGRVLLLGGGPAGEPTEAALARAALHALGVPDDARLVLEDTSRDTLQNLRNARSLLTVAAPGHDAAMRRVTLLSNRYHLARCALFARGLGLHWELCAAEPVFSWRPTTMWRIAGEAAYVCWLDIGVRWAQLIGHRRMIDRIS
ncbi:MAG: YdcF family protein [Luteimonas sp.]